MVHLEITGKIRQNSRGCAVIEVEDSADLGGPFDRAAGVGEPLIGLEHPVADTLMWPPVVVEVAVAPGDAGESTVADEPHAVEAPGDMGSGSNFAQALTVTGRAADRDPIRAALQSAGFVDVKFGSGFDGVALEITAVMGSP